jgi:hypothetical protein
MSLSTVPFPVTPKLSGILPSIRPPTTAELAKGHMRREAFNQPKRIFRTGILPDKRYDPFHAHQNISKTPHLIHGIW